MSRDDNGKLHDAQIELNRQALVRLLKRLTGMEETLSDLFVEVVELQRLLLNSLGSVTRIENRVDELLSGKSPNGA